MKTVSRMLTLAVAVVAFSGLAQAGDYTIEDLTLGDLWYGDSYTVEDLRDRVFLIELWGRN